VSTFLFGALVLALVVAGLLLWRRDAAPRAADGDDPNLEWYRRRRQELSDEAEAPLLEEAKLRLLEEGVADRQPAVLGAGPSRGLGRLPWLLLPLVLVAAAALYSQLGAYQDVLIYRQLERLDPENPAQLARLREQIAARSARTPDNLQYLDLLGQLQLSAQDYAGAAESYARLAERAPEDPQILAQAAQTRFLANDRVLDARAQLLAEQSLAVNPQQQTALGLLGMAAFERQQYAAAVGYWERLQALESPGSAAYEMLDDVIGIARSRAPELAAAESPAPSAPAGDAPGITVRLSLPAQVDVAPEATVFLFARSPSAGSRMPIAVRRLSAGQLPLTLRLSDADSMAGQMLSAAGEVVVSAQLSRNGQPGEANAAFIGRTEPLVADRSQRVVELEMTPAGD
jgi:cytochrome c-type biogenesis protein CcmH